MYVCVCASNKDDNSGDVLFRSESIITTNKEPPQQHLMMPLDFITEWKHKKKLSLRMFSCNQNFADMNSMI